MENKVAGEKITTENPCNFESHTAEAENNLEKDTGDNSLSLGKFKDVQSLFDAYNSLQAEFTRRCQRVKELERENERLNKEITNASKNNLSSGVIEQEDVKKVAENTSLKVNDGTEEVLAQQSLQEQIDYYKSREYLLEALNQNQELKNEIINGYLTSVQSSKPTVKLMTGNGSSVVTPPSKPKTLVEAGEIARQIFEN